MEDTVQYRPHKGVEDRVTLMLVRRHMSGSMLQHPKNIKKPKELDHIPSELWFIFFALYDILYVTGRLFNPCNDHVPKKLKPMPSITKLDMALAHRVATVDKGDYTEQVYAGDPFISLTLWYAQHTPGDYMQYDTSRFTTEEAYGVLEIPITFKSQQALHLIL